MNLERGLAMAALAVGLALGGVAAAPGTATVTPRQKPAAPAPAPTPSPQDQAMANWQKAATPGAEQKVLENFVGHWTSHVKMQMDPAQPAQESDGTSDGKMIMGGRYALVEHKGTMMGQPFEGMMLCGYDNIAKKYVSNWVDNMGTGIIHYDGSYDRHNKRLMMGASFVDPFTRKLTHTRSVTTFVSPTTWTYDEFAPGPDGKEHQVMAITFKKG